MSIRQCGLVRIGDKDRRRRESTDMVELQIGEDL